MFGWFRWYLAKRRLTAIPSRHRPEHITSTFEENQAKLEDIIPNAAGYRRLAALWDEYAATFVPDYGPFLASARNYYRCPIRSVLDLACGTGLLTRQLARWADRVVGLDASEDMLREARFRTRESNIRYAQGDFRDFFVDGTFDAAICGSDSLNYVSTSDELTDVFRCVGQHLRPGGLFAFDVLDHWYFQATMGMKIVVKVRDEQFELCNYYDPVKRVVESFVVFQDVVERHRRVSINEGEVVRAARKAKLECLERISNATLAFPARQFYLLRVPRS